MDPLFALFNPVVSMLNRQIAAVTPARELCARLDTRTIAVRVRNTALAVALTASRDRLDLNTLDDVEPDVIVSGSLLSLARLAGEDGEALIRDGRIELTGDAMVANDFRELLRYARPDFEEQLSGVIGDTAAHGIGDVVRNVSRWGRAARDTLRSNVGEYLQEESRSVPSRYEVDEFRNKVHKLRDDVERAAARMTRLESGRDND
jgi:ubiquinone biosynthesis accessory factor UbiJ